jgi:mycothiol synthase
VDLTWRPLAAGDIPAVAALAGRCLAADGGLPLVADEPFVRRRYAAEGARGTVAEAADGILVAAGATRPDGVGVRVTGLVDPAHRGRGIGARLLDGLLADADDLTADADADGGLAVETESLTDTAAGLFESRGLTLTWAEDVMRLDAATPLPDLAPPATVTMREWTDERAGRFFAVYEAAFRGRPGFPGWSRERWVDWIAGDEDFRPRCSLLAVEHGRDVAFVACADGWIVQVGVRPNERGRGLGAALVVAAARRMRADGLPEVLLDVNVDNPAGALYRRLGFAVIGRRARFSRPPRP